MKKKGIVKEWGLPKMTIDDDSDWGLFDVKWPNKDEKRLAKKKAVKK